jgi:hypothetical protein
MSGIRQGGLFCNNTVKASGGGVGIGDLAGFGLAAAMVGLAMTVGALIGGAVALTIIVCGSTASGCMLLRTAIRSGLEVAHWRKFGELPPARQHLLSLRRTPPPAIERPQPIEHAAYPPPNGYAPLDASQVRWGSPRPEQSQ